MDGRKVRTGVCIYAADVPKMVAFYRDIMGFEAKWDGGDFAEFVTASGELSFFMYSREQFDKALNLEYQPPCGINQTFEIGMWLPTFADVDAEYERKSKIGGISIPADAPITFTLGIRNLYVADPEGKLLEIGSSNQG